VGEGNLANLGPLNSIGGIKEIGPKELLLKKKGGKEVPLKIPSSLLYFGLLLIILPLSPKKAL